MTRPRSNQSGRWQSSVMTAFILSGAIAAALWRILKIQPGPAWLIGASLVTFVTYGIDKLAAGHGWRRTPEWAIWVLIVAGGAPGGWCGQILFHHKTRKGSFWTVLVLATLLQGGILWYFRDHLAWRRG